MTKREKELYISYIDKCGDFHRNPCLETETEAYEAYKALMQEARKQEFADFRISQCWIKHVISGYENQCLWEEV